MTSHRSLPGRTVAAGTALATAGLFSLMPLAHAASSDADGDGIPNRWERSHGMNPFKATDARADFDQDRLANLREYRLGSRIRDEDTDNDGHDDGDEVKDGFRSTDIDDPDTDNDDVEDGDEDGDHDGLDNEDEDDASERCRADDHDRDHDDVDDEDENEFGGSVRDADSDDDGVSDGDEDGDEDGESDEDEDDSLKDECSDDSDEDEGDLFGSIVSFNEGTGVLTLRSVAGNTLSLEVTEDTEVEIEGDPAPGTATTSEESDEDGDEQEEREGTTADLLPGTQVAEIEIDDETGTLEEITLYA